MDYSTIAGAADWSAMLSQLAAVGGAVALVLVAIRGGRKLLGFIAR